MVKNPTFRLVTVNALLLVAAGSVPAVAQNYEYSPTYQLNLGQIGVTSELHADLKSYIAESGNSTAVNNVAIGILDGLADSVHTDLNGRLSEHLVYPGRYRRYDNHGTHVAGIAGANQNNSGIVGVAPTAKLLSIPVFDRRGWVAHDLGKVALDQALSLGAKVINMSYGLVASGDVFSSGELNLFDDYHNSMVLVRAAGNSRIGALHENYAGDASASLSHLLIVGSVGPNNQISNFSTRPGTACIGPSLTCDADDRMRNFFIVAPGENILSDLRRNRAGNSRYGYASGTSMAAPHVAGAAALVFQEALAGNTLLSPGEVASILKLSATDLGTAGVDAVYGYGLLNVSAALGPIGGTSIATGSDVESGLVPTDSSALSTSSVLGRSRALETALSGMVLFDRFDRGFVMDNIKLSRAELTPAADALAALHGSLAQKTTSEGDGSYSIAFTSTGTVDAGGLNALSLASGAYVVEGGLGDLKTYFMESSQRSTDIYTRQLGAEFFIGAGDVGQDFAQAFFIGGDVALSPTITLSALYINDMPEGFGSSEPLIDDLVFGSESSSDLIKVGIRYALSDAAALGLNFAVLKEEEQVLGIENSGAFSLGGTSATQLFGMNFRTDLGANTELSAFGEISVTSAGATDAPSVFAAADEWVGSRLGVALGRSNAFQASDHMQLSLVRPWIINEGELTAQIATGRELDGTIVYETRNVSLARDEFPTDLGLTYTAGDVSFSYGATLSLRDEDVRQPNLDDFAVALAAKLAF
jgi:hypothetical protein